MTAFAPANCVARRPGETLSTMTPRTCASRQAAFDTPAGNAAASIGPRRPVSAIRPTALAPRRGSPSADALHQRDKVGEPIIIGPRSVEATQDVDVGDAGVTDVLRPLGERLERPRKRV